MIIKLKKRRMIVAFFCTRERNWTVTRITANPDIKSGRVYQLARRISGSTTLHQKFNILSAFLFLDLKFPIRSSSSWRVLFIINEAPGYIIFSGGYRTIVMTRQTGIHILAMPNIITVVFSRVQYISMKHRVLKIQKGENLFFAFFDGTRERNWTVTRITANRILSPACLPVPPPECLVKKKNPDCCRDKFRAEDRARTGHPDLGKVVLYQMSYFR